MNFVISLDPEGATEATILAWSGELDKITQARQGALKVFEKEKAEADQAQAEYDRELKVAEMLDQQLETVKKDGKADQIASLEASLAKKVGQLEAKKPDVDREVQEAKDAEAYLKTWDEAAELMAKKLVTARRNAKAAQQRMESAGLKAKLAEERKDQAEILAGIRTETDQLGNAVAAMEAKAVKLEQRAGEADFKAKKLTEATTAPPEEEDANIAAARRAEEEGGTRKLATFVAVYGLQQGWFFYFAN